MATSTSNSPRKSLNESSPSQPLSPQAPLINEVLDDQLDGEREHIRTFSFDTQISGRDDENVDALSQWLIRSLDIDTDDAHNYASAFVAAGANTLSQLHELMKKNKQFLTSCHVKTEDAKDITLALQKLAAQQDIRPSDSVAPSQPHILPRTNSLNQAPIPSILSPRVIDTGSNQQQQQQVIEPLGDIDQVIPAPPVKPTRTPEEIEILMKLKKYRQTVQLKPPSAESIREAKANVDSLNSANEMKMEVAILGVLNTIAGLVVGHGDNSRAFYKENAAAAVVNTLVVNIAHAVICEKAMLLMAILCRHSDDNKSSVCLENAKALGVAGAPFAIAQALLKHANDHKILTSACDAIRCMCILQSNRNKFGEFGVCETVARALAMKRFVDSPETSCWICRALGHLALDNEVNQEKLGNVGASATIVGCMQIHVANVFVCTEACWALRRICTLEKNRQRILDDFGPETMISVLKTFFKDENFMIECCKAIMALLLAEDDPLVERVVLAGAVPLLIKGVKKNQDSEDVATWAFNILYYVSCDDRLRLKLCGSDVLDLLSLVLEAHAGTEGMAEFGCRTVHNLIPIENVSSRMRNAGLCEMVVSCVQRQAISPAVCGYGCLAIGDLAMDKANHSRLTDSGACEAVVASLKRHDENPDVVFQTCHAIHYLAQTENNVGWIGANGGCEAVKSALAKHVLSSLNATRSSLRALGSLAFEDEGNQLRFHAADACTTLVTAVKTHGMDALTAEYGFRAFFNLCAENANVSELGSKGACTLVAAGLQKHGGVPAVLTQACLATYGLAVKNKTDKVHNGNTRKLVSKGVVESIIAAMRKYFKDVELQKAGAMAIASLARLEANREALGTAGAVEIILAGFANHFRNDGVVAKLVLATDRLMQDSMNNKMRFLKGNIPQILLSSMTRHEKSADVIGESFRALVNLSSLTPCPDVIRAEESLKLYVHALRLHDKLEYVARWGCNLVYCCAVDDWTRSKLGEFKACEAVVSALHKHSVASAQSALWSSKALVALSMVEQNKQRFVNADTCSNVVKALDAHFKDAVASEWICAAVVSLGTVETNRLKLGGACASLCRVLTEQMTSSEIVVQLACEAVYELCAEDTNRTLFASAGAVDLLVTILNTHVSHMKIAQQVCRALSGLARPANHSNNAASLGTAGVCQAVVAAIKTHSFTASMVESGCAAVSSLCERNANNQNIFFSMIKDPSSNIFKLIVFILHTHRNTSSVCFQACKAARSLAQSNEATTKQLSISGIVPAAIKVLKSHKTIDFVVEHSCWLLANILTPETLSSNDSDNDIYSHLATSPLKESSSNKSATTTTTTEAGVTTTMVSTSSSSVPVKTSSVPNCFELYKITSNWDILLSALQTNFQKHWLARWICAAVSVFADHGRLTNLPLCDAVISTLTRHMDNEVMVMRALHAVGKLSEFNEENKKRLVKGQAIEIIDRILNNSSEGEAVCVGTFCAIAGLAKNSPENQERFSSFPNLCKLLIKFLYSELESERVSHWGCQAISALSVNNRVNQGKLSTACNFLADILEAHYKNPVAAREACRAIATISHGHITNRNKLGAADACAVVPKALGHHLDNHDVAVWAVRAIANLAANNPNNQTKLGINGACSHLVNAVKQIVCTMQANNNESGRSNNDDQSNEMVKKNADMAKWCCWAIGNIVQLGKGAAMTIDENNNNGKKGGVNFMSAPLKKNTAHLSSAGASVIMLQLLQLFESNAEVVQWGARAINNMAKSRTLKSELLAAQALDQFNQYSNKYSNNKEVQQWLKLAIETLQQEVPYSPATTIGSSTTATTTTTTSNGNNNSNGETFLTRNSLSLEKSNSKRMSTKPTSS